MSINDIKAMIRKNRSLRLLVTSIIRIRALFTFFKRRKRMRILDFLRRALAYDPIIRLDEFKGVFNIGRDSDILKRVVVDGCYEPEIAKLCIRYCDTNRDAVDVGANVGFYTVLFAKNLPLRRVLAVEPTPGALERLKTNICLNQTAENTIVFEGMASHIRGVSDIKFIPGKEEYSTAGALVHPSVSGQPFSVIQVKTERLDDLVLSHRLNPGLIKIDAEGGEKSVIEGAVRILREHRPVIISELSNFLLKRNRTSALEVIRLLESFSYEVINVSHPSYPVGFGEFEDVLCIPKERAGIR